jgi:hypothetical protein
MNFVNSLQSMPPLEIAAVIVFILYIIYPFDTPEFVASSVDSPLGMIIMFCITVFLFMNANPLLGVLYIFVVYELLRRSGQFTGKVAMIQYTPSQANKDVELKKMNPPQPKTLEEDIVEQRGPIHRTPPTQYADSNFKPVADKLIPGASMV